MTQELVPASPAGCLADFADRLPPMIAGANDRTAWRFHKKHGDWSVENSWKQQHRRCAEKKRNTT